MNEGIVYFSPIKSFRESKESERGDELEGTMHIINDEFVKIEYNHPALGKLAFQPIPNKLGRITEFVQDHYCSFCSYALTDSLFANKDEHFIDKRMLDFGEYALVIQKPNKFLSLIVDELKKQSILFEMNYIDYKDLSVRGDFKIDLFTKKHELSHQAEHRILIKTENKDPMIIKIGSIKEFCILTAARGWVETKFIANRAEIN